MPEGMRASLLCYARWFQRLFEFLLNNTLLKMMRVMHGVFLIKNKDEGFFYSMTFPVGLRNRISLRPAFTTTSMGVPVGI